MISSYRLSKLQLPWHLAEWKVLSPKKCRAEWRRNLSGTWSAVENENVDETEKHSRSITSNARGEKPATKSSLKVAKKLLKVGEKSFCNNVRRWVAQASLERVIFHAYSRLARQEASSGYCGFVFGALVGVFCASASADSPFPVLVMHVAAADRLRKSPVRDYFSIKNYSPCRGVELRKFMKWWTVLGCKINSKGSAEAPNDAQLLKCSEVPARNELCSHIKPDVDLLKPQ